MKGCILQVEFKYEIYFAFEFKDTLNICVCIWLDLKADPEYFMCVLVCGSVTFLAVYEITSAAES